MKAEERKRKAEETTEREERAKLRKEWDKNYEVKTNLLFYKKKKKRTICFWFLFFRKVEKLELTVGKHFKQLAKQKIRTKANRQHSSNHLNTNQKLDKYR